MFNNNKTANIKDKNLKVYNDVYGRLYTLYHTTKTAKIKSDITPHYIDILAMCCRVISLSFLFFFAVLV